VPHLIVFFVMVGPVVKIDPASLPRRVNIHWLGQQPRRWTRCIARCKKS